MNFGAIFGRNRNENSLELESNNMRVDTLEDLSFVKGRLRVCSRILGNLQNLDGVVVNDVEIGRRVGKLHRHLLPLNYRLSRLLSVDSDENSIVLEGEQDLCITDNLGTDRVISTFGRDQLAERDV